MLNRFFKNISKKSGLPPGTSVYFGDKKTEKVKITIIDYDKDKYEEKQVENIQECFPYPKTKVFSI